MPSKIIKTAHSVLQQRSGKLVINQELSLEQREHRKRALYAIKQSTKEPLSRDWMVKEFKKLSERDQEKFYHKFKREADKFYAEKHVNKGARIDKQASATANAMMSYIDKLNNREPVKVHVPFSQTGNSENLQQPIAKPPVPRTEKIKVKLPFGGEMPKEMHRQIYIENQMALKEKNASPEEKRAMKEQRRHAPKPPPRNRKPLTNVFPHIVYDSPQTQLYRAQADTAHGQKTRHPGSDNEMRTPL